MKKIIIMGATSGIGRETAFQYISDGWTVGIAGRRAESLQRICQVAPDRIHAKVIDVCANDAPLRLQELIDEMGGMDVYLHSSGIGFQNPTLDEGTELDTIRTNGDGFTRMVAAAFNYFKTCPQGGHIAVISSVAGTKGLGIAPAYSATKRFQRNYIQALSQLAHIQKLPITFTDIRPGFVATELLKSRKFPMLMQPGDVARHIFCGVNSRKRVLTIDWRYRVLVALWRLIPDCLWERMRIS